MSSAAPPATTSIPGVNVTHHNGTPVGGAGPLGSGEKAKPSLLDRLFKKRVPEHERVSYLGYFL